MEKLSDKVHIYNSKMSEKPTLFEKLLFEYSCLNEKSVTVKVFYIYAGMHRKIIKNLNLNLTTKTLQYT